MIVFRTHFWDDDISFLFRQLDACAGGRAVIAADKTTVFSTDHPDREISHDVDQILEMGLPAYPSRQKMLWYNGDYVLYHLLMNSDAPDIFMFDNDVLVQDMDLVKLRDGFRSAGADFVAPHVINRDDGSWNYWASRQREWIAAEFGNTAVMPIIYSSFFPVVYLTRAAAGFLLSRRLEMAAFLRDGPGNLTWPQVESFVPTELARANYLVQDIGKYLDAIWRLTMRHVQTLREARASDLVMSHPVVTGERFVKKLVIELRERSGGSLAGILDGLRAARMRNIDAGTLAALDRAIASELSNQPG